MKVDLIDLGIGNTRSVTNWLTKVNCDVNVINRVEDINSELLVMPGVGAAGKFMHKLRKTGFDNSVRNHVSAGGRLLGICLGFQVMFEYSEEDGGVQTLGILGGKVERLRGVGTHNGWEQTSFDFRQVDISEHWRKAKLTRAKVLCGRFFYNHEYAAVNGDRDQRSFPISNSLKNYSGVVISRNVIGVQYHPEKSQQSGIEFLRHIL
ncbi:MULTISPECIES: imidazole glycerol phosphate synthase subunit HisH [unclassified Halomonas]|uniref:imidazole glycerol phosphate synthase subunit HisH n=1 Tax=unclassified Halomonas TaxID=2609666 RepID=UPI0007D9E7E3|nr:imidazole glycerol phosphate synthase subunit HisH [Halomonas sp. ALS9]MBT2786006.1 imidazole glycerol phosphate synthase subunit HisH [Halomonas sp. ISL-106]MBT2797028.1 imidazole glycerol phosphate synthase subunit HisH [Halomonas sp. ISL-104]OAL58415.1 imidazole glycerol phosphate synthase, glutamine amidotransferase subunit [Halomonas sp. ALS9]